MLKGKMDFRIGNDRKSMIARCCCDTRQRRATKSLTRAPKVVDIFAPRREDFLTSEVPPYMRDP